MPDTCSSLGTEHNFQTDSNEYLPDGGDRDVIVCSDLLKSVQPCKVHFQDLLSMKISVVILTVLVE